MLYNDINVGNSRERVDLAVDVVGKLVLVVLHDSVNLRFKGNITMDVTHLIVY